MVTYDLLQPQDSGPEPEPLKAGELLVVCEKELWKTVKIISKCLERKEASGAITTRAEGFMGSTKMKMRSWKSEMDFWTKIRTIGAYCAVRTHSWT